MPQVGFEPTIPAFERAKTVHALDRSATVIGLDPIGLPIIIVIITAKTKLNSVAVVRKWNIPTERPPLFGEVSANLCG
jgi:hypothetical protein